VANLKIFKGQRTRKQDQMAKQMPPMGRTKSA